MTLRQLLTEYVALLAKHGIDSKEEIVFAREHQSNPEFDGLARTARWLTRHQLVTRPRSFGITSLLEKLEELRGLINTLSMAFSEVMDQLTLVHNLCELEEYSITPERASEIANLATKVLNK